MSNKLKKGFTILETLVAIAIATILLVMFLWAYKQFLDVRNKISYENKFNTLVEKLSVVLKDPERIKTELLTPRYVAKLNPDISSLHSLINDKLGDENMLDNENILWINTEKMIMTEDTDKVDENFFSNIYNLTILNLKDTQRLSNQLDFLSMSKNSMVFNGSDVPLLFIQSRYGTSSQGIKYPYKIFNVIIMDPMLFKRLKLFCSAHPDKFKDLFTTVFTIGDNGVTVNYGLNINNDDETFVDLMKMWLGNDYKTEWNRLKYSIIVKTIDNSEDVKKIVEDTYNKMYSIKKNIEDWAVIQARIAAYDSTNGNNMDKDYFITLGANDVTDSSVELYSSTENGDIDKTRTLLPESEAQTIVEGDTTNTDEINEKDMNNGFFICTEAQDNPSTTDDIEKYYCSGKPIAYIGEDGCEQKIDLDTLPDSVTTEYLVNINTYNGFYDSSSDDKGCLLSIADRQLLSSVKFYKNVFNIPVMFTDTAAFKIDFKGLYLNSAVTNPSAAVSSEPGVYVERNSVPLQNGTANPPYTAKIVTFFPWVLGGIEPDGEYNVEPEDGYIYPYSNTDGIGVISMPIFAHVF